MSDKFSIAMIVRNCANILDRCLTSVQGMQPDEIVIVNTALDRNEDGSKETDAVAHKHGARVEYFPWNGSFADARNFSFEQCRNDFVMWLDSDDTVGEPEKLRAAISRLVASGANVLDIAYLYEWNGEPGESAVTTSLRRERVVRRSDFEWKSPIHEVLICRGRPEPMQLDTADGYVMQHLTKGADDPRPKLLRNLEIFEREWPDGDCEARMKFYWGNTLKGLQRPEEAIQKYTEYINTPGVAPMERLVALQSTSDCYRAVGQPQHALQYAMKAITQEPGLPSPWMMAAEACFSLRDWRRAKTYADEALLRKDKAQYEMVSNPASLAARPHFISAIYEMEVRNNAQAAMKHANKAAEYFPEDPGVIRLCQQIADILNDTKAAVAFDQVCREIVQDDPDLAEKVAQIAPGRLKYDPAMHRYWQIPFEESGRPRLAIMCQAVGIQGFDHTSLIKGISGSEEATVHIARQFAGLGWEVDIYNERDMGAEDGESIRYLPFSCWREDHPYDAVIYWRASGLLKDYPTKAPVKLLWLHDVVDPSREPPRYWEGFTKVLCLSEFHREVCELGDAGDKVYITRNGIDVDSMPEPGYDLDMVVWPSDPYRGATVLYNMWDELKTVRPNLHLHILYGFSGKYEQDMAAELARGETTKKRIKEATLAFGQRDDCTYHGMVPQAECHELMARAGWWLYPTYFPEISCITAMKAQALGCRSIVTDGFALSETMKHGLKIPPDFENPLAFAENFKKVTMEVMDDPSKMEKDVEEGIAWGRTLGWRSVAEDWDRLIRLEAAKVDRLIPEGALISSP